MATGVLQQVRRAVGNLNPQEVRDTAERPLAVRLVASNSAGYAAMEEFLSPRHFSKSKRWEQVQALHRADDPGAPDRFDIEIYEAGLPRPEQTFAFYPDDPDRTAREILVGKEDLGLPLARYFHPFREPVAEKVIVSIAKENALFSLATALPNIAPGIQLPWAIGEFGSDTAFLTVNQIRMLFLLAGASDRPVGYREQRAEIAGVIAGAFGWRALARQLTSKIPLGGGIIPKAAVAFAGSYVVGRSTERLYRIGYGYSRKERQLAYKEAFERGKRIAGSLLSGIRDRRAGPQTSHE